MNCAANHGILMAAFGGELRYWKGAYDENGERDLELRSRMGLAADQDETREMWFFRALVAIQLVLITLAGLLFVR